MIISLGYRIKSKIAMQCRQWATKRLNEYIRKGFTMDDERLKEAGGGDYWKELLARIRDIRSSEKVWICMLQVLIIILSRLNLLHFLRWFRINFTML